MQIRAPRRALWLLLALAPASRAWAGAGRDPLADAQQPATQLIRSARGVTPPASGQARSCASGQRAGVRKLRVLQINVGNADFACDGALFKLCRSDVEDRIRTNLHKATAHETEPFDIVFIEELISSKVCRNIRASETPGHACYHYAERREQVRRILDDQYTIVCDPDGGLDCVGINNAILESVEPVDGRTCALGNLCGDASDFSKDDIGISNYIPPAIHSPTDPGFMLSRVDVTLSGLGKVRLIVGHPESGGPRLHDRMASRAEQLREVFLSPDFAGEDVPLLMAGDLNLDPCPNGPGDWDDSVALWRRFVGPDKKLHEISGCQSTTNYSPLIRSVILGGGDGVLDHVLSNFATGSCAVMDGDRRFDGGDDCDHNALICSIEAPTCAPAASFPGGLAK